MSATKIVIDGESVDVVGVAQEVYFTEETRIGTWIDGKPLYRKVINTTSSKVTKQGEPIATLPDECVICNFYGYLLTESLSYIPTNLYLGGRYSATWVVEDRTIMQSTDDYTNRPVTMIVEYTKTTDGSDTV